MRFLQNVLYIFKLTFIQSATWHTFMCISICPHNSRQYSISFHSALFLLEILAITSGLRGDTCSFFFLLFALLLIPSIVIAMYVSDCNKLAFELNHLSTSLMLVSPSIERLLSRFYDNSKSIKYRVGQK